MDGSQAEAGTRGHKGHAVSTGAEGTCQRDNGIRNTCFCGMLVLEPCPYTPCPHRNNLGHLLAGTAFPEEEGMGTSCLLQAKTGAKEMKTQNRRVMSLKCFPQNSDARGFSRLSVSFLPEAYC